MSKGRLKIGFSFMNGKRRLKTGNLVFRRHVYQIFTESKGVMTKQYVLQQLLPHRKTLFSIGQLKKARQRSILLCNVSKL